jgi:hypothetical protein
LLRSTSTMSGSSGDSCSPPKDALTRASQTANRTAHAHSCQSTSVNMR